LGFFCPYRKNVAGVSVPSRFYSLLAIGRPVLIISKPDAEASLTVSGNRLGWVVTPCDACELAKTIRFASSYKEIKLIGAQVATIAARFNAGSALARYQSLVETLLQKLVGDRNERRPPCCFIDRSERLRWPKSRASVDG
jgi:hypothetical protein